MTKRQNEFSQMLATLRVVCNKYQTTWKDSVTFSAAFNDGVRVMEEALIAALSQQMTTSTSITKNKAQVREKLSLQLRQLASRMELYAVTAANATLQKEARLTPTAIKIAKDDALVGMVARITGLATTHLADIAAFGVTAADVSTLSTAGASYAAMIGAPARERNVSKEGTKTMVALIETSRAKLRIMDAHMVLWYDSDPSFYSEYTTARRIHKPGYRTRALEVSVQDAKGEPVARAAFHLPSEGLMRKTSEKGLCRISHLSAGEHRALVSAEGYAEQEVPFAIGHGQKTRLVVCLNR